MSDKKSSKQQTANDKRFEELEQQVAELTEALQRERADAMNVRRRSEEERAAMSTFYKANVVRELLPVIDNFERAMNNPPKILIANPNGKGDHDQEWARGIKKIYDQLRQSFEKIGVESIGKVGEPFDPKFHEAVSMDGGDGDHEVVGAVLQAGYKMGDEVIRHAMVKVRMESKQSSNNQAKDKEE